MTELLTPDLCVIGGGSGGLSVTAAAAQLGVDVVLIEKAKMGGDCLNYGCVPSKALIAASRRAHLMRASGPFGVGKASPRIDPRAVHDHIKSVIAAIEPNDSVERFSGLGVRVIQAEARFTDARTVEADGQRIRARRFVVATGSTPAIPPIKGLDTVAYFTNETIFDNTAKLERLIVLGGGPIGLELAQAYRRLGSEVTVIEAMTPLNREDPELAAMVVRRVRAEGVQIHDDARIEYVEKSAGALRFYVTVQGALHAVQGTHLLLAAGRRPNVDGLGLEAAGIAHDRTGIKVNARLRTSNRRVYSIGDVAGGPQFTHLANHHAGIVIRNVLFRLPARVKADAVPRVTFTDPELAQVGLTEAEARERFRTVHIARWPYAENDRAQAERATEGFVKVVIGARGRILGAGIVGEQAGELIQVWSLAIAQGLRIGAMTGFIAPYPTLGEINKRAAYAYYMPRLTSPLLRLMIATLRRFG